VNLRERELELAWLTKKLKASESLLERAQAYFANHHEEWSKGVTAYFMDMLMRKQDQLYYEQHRHEELAWQLVMERDAKQQ
jgi:hypothetical protein